jgi:hypothetical protein
MTQMFLKQAHDTALDQLKAKLREYLGAAVQSVREVLELRRTESVKPGLGGGISHPTQSKGQRELRNDYLRYGVQYRPGVSRQYRENVYIPGRATLMSIVAVSTAEVLYLSFLRR